MKKIIILVLTVLFSIQSYSGGVSDGGGSTTNPKPVDPQWIAYRIHEIGRIVLAWAYRQEQEFNNLSESEKIKSPMAKLFSGSKNFVDVIQETGFEVRMSGPCFDAKGVPMDGSIYASKTGFLCLSPFLMGPKLTEQNFESETAALMVHELSHVLGTDEEEADQIQQKALWDFERINFLDVYVDLNLLSGGVVTSGSINEALMSVRMMASSPQSFRQSDVRAMWNDLIQLNNHYFNNVSPILYVNEKIQNAFGLYLIKLDTIGLFSCTQDEREYPEVKQYCQEELTKIFQGENQITIRQAILRRDHFDIGADADHIFISNPKSWAEVTAELRDVIAYFESLRDQTKWLYEFRSSVYYTK